jgi:uncharacterized protein (TIGR02145 family)
MKLKLFIIILSVFSFSSCYEDDLYPAPNFSTTGFVPGFKWVLDATGSVSTNGQSLQYRWDYDEDQSQFDTPWLTNPVFIADGKSKTNYIKIVTLQVKNKDGLMTQISKEVYRSGFMYSFRHDTIRIQSQTIIYNSYSWKNSDDIDQFWWTRKNMMSGSSDNIYNAKDSLDNGSYFAWNEAQAFSIPNIDLKLATKQHWDGLITLFYGNELAGYNLQVDNVYGMGLGLFGYCEQNEIKENGEKGYYWTATEVDNDHAWALEITKNSDEVRFVSLPKSYQCKVRLIQPIPFIL